MRVKHADILPTDPSARNHCYLTRGYKAKTERTRNAKVFKLVQPDTAWKLILGDQQSKPPENPSNPAMKDNWLKT